MGNINYSSFKTTYSTKFMGTMLIFFKNQLTTKANVYHPWQTIHFVGMNKPKEAQQQGPAETTQPMCSSQQLKLT